MYRAILLYGIENVHINAENLMKMEPALKCWIKQSLGLYICSHNTNLLIAYLLSEYIANQATVPGTIIDHLIQMSLTLVKIAFREMPDGHLDSMKHLLFDANFVKPCSYKHYLVQFLVKSF